MASLNLRRIDPELFAEIRAFADGKGEGLPKAALYLIAQGLKITKQRGAGGSKARSAATPEQRSAQARKASEARWGPTRTPDAPEVPAGGDGRD